MTQTEDLAQFDPASFEHIPVLLNECLDGLNIDPAGIYLDGTAGGAGHSRQPYHVSGKRVQRLGRLAAAEPEPFAAGECGLRPHLCRRRAVPAAA